MKLAAYTTLGLMACLTWGASAQVQLRGDMRLDAAVAEATLVGLRLEPESSGAPSQLVSWDRVKRVDGEKAGSIERFRTIADKLWRARTRVERSDFAAAEPLLDELEQAYGAERGPSAAVIAECLMRCRLSRGAQGSATAAWLWWSWLMEEKEGSSGSLEWVGGGTSLPPVVDDATGLAPMLPPVWAPVASTGAAAASAEWARLRALGGEVGELAELYEKSARFEAGMDDEIAPPLSAAAGEGGAGVALVREIVMARGGDAAARDAARRALEARVRSIMAAAEGATSGANASPTARATPRWMEAWCRLALGRSLIRETDNALRMRGVIELLHVPARFSREQPFLAGIALADAAVTMARVGDDRAAAALKSELMARHPSHPVVQWEELGKIKIGMEGQRRSASTPVR
jgi:hypothetical protein